MQQTMEAVMATEALRCSCEVVAVNVWVMEGLPLLICKRWAGMGQHSSLGLKQPRSLVAPLLTRTSSPRTNLNLG